MYWDTTRIMKRHLKEFNMRFFKNKNVLHCPVDEFRGFIESELNYRQLRKSPAAIKHSNTLSVCKLWSYHPCRVYFPPSVHWWFLWTWSEFRPYSSPPPPPHYPGFVAMKGHRSDQSLIGWIAVRSKQRLGLCVMWTRLIPFRTYLTFSIKLTMTAKVLLYW